MDNIHGGTKAVGGYIQVSSVQVFALFDPSASHSFISADMVETCKMVKCPTRRPLLVHTPVGEMQVDQICPNVSLDINKENFTATLIVLESLKIRVVLGNGWLCVHKGVIHGTRCTMLLTTPFCDLFQLTCLQVFARGGRQQKRGRQSSRSVLGSSGCTRPTHSSSGVSSAPWCGRRRRPWKIL
jgi:hypothetical protein